MIMTWGVRSPRVCPAAAAAAGGPVFRAVHGGGGDPSGGRRYVPNFWTERSALGTSGHFRLLPVTSGHFRSRRRDLK